MLKQSQQARIPGLDLPAFAKDFTFTSYSQAMDVSQTVAEAVAAATQQQQAAAQQAQQLINQPSPPVQPVQNSSSTIDNLTCQWQGCGERCDSPELLYVSLLARADHFPLDATC